MGRRKDRKDVEAYDQTIVRLQQEKRQELAPESERDKDENDE